MSTSPIYDCAEQLLEKLNENKGQLCVLGSLELYQLGRVLAALPRGSSEHVNVQQACEQVIDLLPNCNSIFLNLYRGLNHVMETHGSDSSGVTTVLQVLAQLVQSSQRAARSLTTVVEFNQLATILIVTYNGASKRFIFEILAAILPILSMEDFVLAIQSLQDHPTLWTELLQFEPSDWKNIILDSSEGDSTQQSYLSSLLFPLQEAPRKLLNHSQGEKQSHSSKKSTTTASPLDEMQRRIDQVRQIFPDLGEGFVEALLGHYKGDIEQTVSIIAEDRLPSTLDHLDRSLPRMLATTTRLQRNIGDSNDDDRAEAIAATKAAIQAAEQAAEREAMAVVAVLRDNDDIYNDDYDDQWDMDHEYDAPDVGLYDTDMDYKNVLLYNKALKEVEADDRFWQDNMNTNLNGRGGSATGETRKPFRGPDKLRGGRIPGRGSGRGAGGGEGGGGGGRGTQKPATQSGDASKNEKTTEPSDGGKTFNKRRKENQISKRKDKQKQAMAKRSGA